MPTSFEAFSEEIRPRRLIDGPPRRPGLLPHRLPGISSGVRHAARRAAAAAQALRCRRRRLAEPAPQRLSPGARP